ncbi:hypothetical protein QTH89_00995 [Variovorax sp. J22G21]|uniref:hypothetical protein n=1 Tax=Variovorax fucosicus TaxID=3053517 RepID=UPI0025779EA0|nr:hypothetical protein [Variovorax sp. J22G21]MDM0042002.1 hypothetical protein [Variovorax sp. J22R193]MDM0059772.1 hypothetical protein [Variovorax sp. J22G21]
MTPLPVSAQIRVHLASDALIACELKREWRKTVVTRKERFEFDAGERAGAMDALAAWITQGPPRRSIVWIIGPTEAQYFVLPWSPALIDRGMRDAYARARYEQLFEQDASGAAFYFAAPSDGNGQLVSCVPIELPAELAAHALRTESELLGIKPAISMVWDRFRDVLETEQGTLCVVDGDRQAIVEHDRKRIEGIVVKPRGKSPALPAKREGVVRRFSNEPSRAQPSASSVDLSLPPQNGFVATQDAAYAFALCGAL